MLVADIIRELLAGGADQAAIMKSMPGKNVENFPLSHTVDSKWMSDVTDYLTKIDPTRHLLKEYANYST